MDKPPNYQVYVFIERGTNKNTATKDILENCALPTFWQQFEESPLLFQNDYTCEKSQVHKDIVWQIDMEEHKWPAQSLDLKPIGHTFEVNWNANFETGILYQH